MEDVQEACHLLMNIRRFEVGHISKWFTSTFLETLVMRFAIVFKLITTVENWIAEPYEPYL